MPASDALIVGEDWISEHYFTTDAPRGSFQARVLERRKEWDEAEKDGLDTPRSRYRAAHARLESLLASLAVPGEDAGDAPSPTSAEQSASDAAAADLDALLREILGYTSGEYALTERGAVTLVRPRGDEGPAPAALLRATPVTTVEDLLAKDAPTLAEPWTPVDLSEPEAPTLEDADPVVSVPRALSTLLTDEHGPAFVVVLAGRWALLAEKERWPEGRWLAVDVQVVVERNALTKGGEVERALAILDARSVLPAADATTWWQATLEDSAAHTVGVSKDLREGVRLSIEIIANEVVARRAARGLGPLPQLQAQPLALQSLRYLYRIIFLLYAEASPELGVLPVGASEYDAGYGLDRLRDLTQREIQEEASRSGTHIYESLGALFQLVDTGLNAGVTADQEEVFDGLVFQPLRADLFRPENTALIDEVGLGNGAMLRVLRHLLLTTPGKNKDAGFISYVELGINQLGAVYEGLMSYTGSFATETLWEVAPGGDASKGSWVVPRDVMEGLDPKDFVTRVDEVTGERTNVTHAPGTFVFRLSGRDRQRSASYYTPEVLTRFTVQQALEELLDQDGHTTTAEEILALSVCEPALGSGAFAIEAVRQLAEQYLARREKELGRRVDPEERPRELQKVKAHIALHQVYGVDLNATAVELAEVSLWLDTMVEGLAAPWFGLRLRRGNSLVGAKRALYDAAQLKKSAWLTATPTSEPLSQVADAIDAADQDAAHRTGGALDVSGRIHHFLLPAQGWGSAVEVPKQVRDLLDPEHLKTLKTWRRSLRKAPTAAQSKRLVALAGRVEVLWEFTLRRLRIAERQSSRRIGLWGRADAGETAEASSVTRERIEDYLSDPTNAYRRLRLVMDAWCALWYWPLNKPNVAPPTLDEWIGALEGILGVGGKAAPAGAATLAEATTWEELDDAEQVELGFGGVRKLSDVKLEAPWLYLVENIAREQGFFHWELDFATIFGRGGFDLQVGNPPWVRPRTDVEGLLAEGDPWWQLANSPSVAEKRQRQPRTLTRSGVEDLVVNGTSEVTVLAELLGDATLYPLLSGQPDLYRAFMCTVWEHLSPRGTASMIHPDSHFTDARTQQLRVETYRHLRRHWQFFNELQLFEVDHHVGYGVHSYGAAAEPDFLQASSLYHPDTVVRSLVHDGSGEEPGFKDPNTGKWDLRPHASRIQRVTECTLRTWQSITEAGDWRSTPMVYTVNSAAARTLATLSKHPRVGSLGLKFSRGWDESIDRQKGRFVREWGRASWEDAILQGPHLHVSNPMYKSPNPTMKHNQDWSPVDLETLPPDATPITSYKPAGDRVTYDAAYTHWGDTPARDHYRIAWRAMAANTGARTLIPAMIPPGAAHPNGVFSVGSPDLPPTRLVLALGGLSSLLADFTIRALPKSGIYFSDLSRVPTLDPDHELAPCITLRTLRLNCVTDAYADLWETCWDDRFPNDDPRIVQTRAANISPTWTSDTPLRDPHARRAAQIEIDKMVATMLSVPLGDLETIYRTQFSVLYGYDSTTTTDGTSAGLGYRNRSEGFTLVAQSLAGDSRIPNWQN